MRFSRSLLLALAALAVVQGLYFYPRMPEVVASHFDASGAPDGYQSREVFFALLGAVFVLTAVPFIFIGPLLARVPARFWNLPDRDYWLAEERAPETRAFVSTQMEWFGAVTMALLLLSLQMVYESNLSADRTLEGRGLWWLLGGYTLATVVWLLRFLRHFRAPRREERA